jgi:hypothetical protein
MPYGRIVRITYTLGGPYATYIVAEESSAKATAMMKAQVGADASVECIGRASKELLRAVGLSAGEFKRWIRTYEKTSARPVESDSRAESRKGFAGVDR